MSTIKEIQSLNQINKDDTNSILEIVYKAISINREYKSDSVVNKKSDFIFDFTELLEGFIDKRFFKDKNEKLDIMNFIDKLNTQKEILELQKDNILSLKKASIRLGKKSQSAFDKKF